MHLELPSLGPRVRLVMVVDVAEEDAVLGSVHDYPNVSANPDRPEVLVFRLVQSMDVGAGANVYEFGRSESAGLEGTELDSAARRACAAPVAQQGNLCLASAGTLSLEEDSSDETGPKKIEDEEHAERVHVQTG